MDRKDCIEFLKGVNASLKHSTPKMEVETITSCGIKDLIIRFFVDDPSQYEALSYDIPDILKAGTEYFGDNYEITANSIEFYAPVAEIMPDGSVQQHPLASDEFYNSWCKYENQLNAELGITESKVLSNKATSQEVVENNTKVRDDKALCEAAREVLHDSTDRNIILCTSIATALITLAVMVANEYNQNRQYYEETEKSRMPRIWKATKSVSKKPKTWFMVTCATLAAATCAFAVRMSKRV